MPCANFSGSKFESGISLDKPIVKFFYKELMQKIFSILICLVFFAASIAAAWPICASERTELSCLLAHAAAGPSTWEAEQGSIIEAEVCPCQNQDLCLGCCRTHTYISWRTLAGQQALPRLAKSLIFSREFLVSIQAENRIDRPPIS
jgi:hypothetical protein